IDYLSRSFPFLFFHPTTLPLVRPNTPSIPSFGPLSSARPTCSPNIHSFQQTVSRFIQTVNQRIHPVLSCVQRVHTYQSVPKAPIDNLEPNTASHASSSTFPDQEA
ncbi:hypothetical protein CT0861_08870, partial [Colletotrichum tofieldiae]